MKNLKEIKHLFGEEISVDFKSKCIIIDGGNHTTEDVYCYIVDLMDRAENMNKKMPVYCSAVGRGGLVMHIKKGWEMKSSSIKHLIDGSIKQDSGVWVSHYAAGMWN